MPGHTAAAAAPVAGSDSGHKRRWSILAHAAGSLGGLVHRHKHRRGGRRRLTARRWPGLAPFAAVYLLYDASRWIFAGHLPVARQHAHKIVNLERSLHLAPGPSLHVGLAFAVGFAAAAALRARWARGLAFSWAPLVTLSVLATGNHYLFDVAAGLVVTGAGFWAGRLTTRPFQQRPGVPSVRRLIPATRS